jgi:superfamily II DNA helicase RecQ
MTELGRKAVLTVGARPAHTFTFALLVDCIRGSKRKDICTRRLDALEHFGCGAQLRKPDVERMLRQMVLAHFLAEDHVQSEAWGGVTTYLTDRARDAQLLVQGARRLDVLLVDESKRQRNGAAAANGAAQPPQPPQQRAAQPLQLEQARAAAGGRGGGRGGRAGPSSPRASAARASGAAPPHAPLGGDDGGAGGADAAPSARVGELFAELNSELQAWRNTLSQVLQIPISAVYDNPLLLKVASAMPTTPAELLNVEGVSAHKADTYGSTLLGKITTFLATHPELAAHKRQLMAARAGAGRHGPAAGGAQPQPPSGAEPRGGGAPTANDLDEFQHPAPPARRAGLQPTSSRAQNVGSAQPPGNASGAKRALPPGGAHAASASKVPKAGGDVSSPYFLG